MALPPFKPSIAATLATALVVAVCLRLAFWQLERADTKARWTQEQVERSSGEPMSLPQVLGLDSPANYPVRVRGHFDNSRVVLLDNRVLERVAGYHVLTPLHSESGHWVLVNRGWIARGDDRNVLPDIPPIDGAVTVEGFTYQYSERTFTLAEDDLSAPSWPLRVQKIEIDALAGILGVELAPFEIRVAEQSDIESGAELPRVWHDPVMGPERHQGYAVQWFAMAAAAFIFFVFASFRRRQTSDIQDKSS
ncbi:SURF1 family protein [Alcanivorax sp. 1008]|uniref:SURF1 family protein n=1 Tax=Alcanivorax sp. 1008 TaxID=2816853 RepID=UPI001DBD4DC7|nr:SURF1 family protein [Alcanivorax sp. 1008]MCC1496501.1 SURF1 family protein [Alcanivorax sp. 1008]